MTPEDLRAARIAEAWRRSDGSVADTLGHLADLYETNWTPPEPADPDLLAAREWYASVWKVNVTEVADTNPLIRTYLAGCTRGRDGTKGLVEALEEALAGWEDCAIYKGDFLLDKHGDLEGIAKGRATLAAAKGERV